MKSMYAIAFILLMGSAFGQTQKDLSIQYHPDGGKTIIDDDGKERVTLVLNKDGLCTFKEIQIIGSPRVLRYEFIYDHKNRVTEEIDYSHSSGYRKRVILYNEQGLRTSKTTYESAEKHTKGNWRIVAQLSNSYDELGRITRFESKMIPGRTQMEHFHLINENTFLSNGMTSTLEKELDASGRVIKSGTSKRKSREPSKPYDDNIVAEMRSTAKGFVVTSASEELKSETFYENNRIVQEKFYRFQSGWGDVHSTEFKLWYTFNYEYQNGKLVAQSVLDGEEMKSKRLIEYEGTTPVRFKRYYKQNGSMKLVVKQGFTPAHEPYFPKLMPDYESGNNLSAFGDGTDEPLNEVYQSPYEDLYETPVYEESIYSDGIVNALEQTPKLVGSGSMTELDQETQALLDQIRMLANNNSAQEITEAQILHLALEQLVERYREELKQLNQKHLESQQSMFD